MEKELDHDSEVKWMDILDERSFSQRPMGVVNRGYRTCVMLINPYIEATPLVLHGLVPRLDMKGVARSARAHASTDPAAGMRRLSVRQVKSIVQFSASRCEARSRDVTTARCTMRCIGHCLI